MFKILYSIHKLLTFIFTFKWMSFGNFCSFHSSQLDKILSNDSSWLAFSSSIAKNCIIEKMEAETDDDQFADWAAILFDQALLAEGAQLEDPAGFVNKLNKLMLKM